MCFVFYVNSYCTSQQSECAAPNTEVIPQKQIPKKKTIIPVTRKCAADDDLANSMLNLDPLQHPRSTFFPLKDNLYSLLYWLF